MCPQGGCLLREGAACQYNIILKPLSDYQYGHDGCQGHVSMCVQTKSCTKFQIKENQQHADLRRIKEQNASVFSSKLFITSYNLYSAETASLVLLEKLLVAAEVSNQKIIFSQSVCMTQFQNRKYCEVKMQSLWF